MTDAHSPGGAELDRDAVLALIRENPGRCGKREIARALSLTASQKAELRTLLRDLEADGAIERRGRRGYVAADAVPKVSVVEFTGHDRDGELVGRVAGRELDETGPLIRLAAGSGDGRKGGPAVGVGDRALCRLSQAEDGVHEARVIKRFARQGRRSLGVARRVHGGVRIAPADRGQRQELAVVGADIGDVEDGDLVVFTIERERRHGLKTARIAEHVGRADAPHAATVLALHAHGVPVGFSELELAEAQAAAPMSRAGREDLTATPLITIDPEDARDHDDAVWAAPDADAKNPGGWVVIVAIADVAGYVRPCSALDRGAERRGNSVYFPDRVVPMLPERLSTDLCSLRANEERPCMAVRMIFAADGAKRSHRFARATMRSAAKLSYEQAQSAIDGKPDGAAEPLLEPVLKPLWGAYEAVAKARARRAPLEIDSPERRVRVDEAGKVVAIDRPPRLDAHKLIEEFMIQANVAAAETLESKRQPLLYRVHDGPAPEKID
ncbi:MAG: ribonuclease R, partial [Caulobacterales bacterium]|nr:ribonuclease R [Caulobacterales bacterium]